MTAEYNYHYDVQEELETDTNIVDAPKLYNYDPREIYAAAMNLASQPLSNGEESPFSSRSPNSTHARLFEVMSYIQSLIGYEINLIPDNVWLQLLRLRGVEPRISRYPVLEMEFARSQTAVDQNQPVFVPIGTKIYSRKHPDRFVITTDELLIEGSDKVGRVPARLNQKGKTPGINIGEYSKNSAIPNLSYVTNTGVIIQEGYDGEDISDLVKRVRDREGKGDRIVTQRDLKIFAEDSGSQTSLVLPNTFVDENGKSHSQPVTTLFIYSDDDPEALLTNVQSRLEEKMPLDHQIIAKQGLVVPLSGTVEIRLAPESKTTDVFDLVASIISDINPPNGKWGDLRFQNNLIFYLESDPNIYKAEIKSLYVSDLDSDSFSSEEKTNLNNQGLTSGQSFATINVMPWYLFQIQSNLEVKAVN